MESRNNMDEEKKIKKWKIISVIIIGVIAMVFIFIFMSETSKIKSTTKPIQTTQQKKEAKIKKNINNIENQILSNDIISEDKINDICQFIRKYKNEKLVKGDLVNFIVYQANKHSISDSNSYFYLNASGIIGTLNDIYPNNDEIKAIFDEIVSNSQDNNDQDSNNTKSTSTSNKLTSDDGELELEDKNQDGSNIVGSIKNLSSDPYSYVEVDINLYDSNGNQVDSTLTNVTNLEGNGTWNFSAPVINQDNVASYRVISIKGNK